MNYPNGRVNILNNTPNSVFNLYDKIPVEQNITSYRNALTGNLEDNMLSKVFFSKVLFCASDFTNFLIISTIFKIEP